MSVTPEDATNSIPDETHSVPTSQRKVIKKGTKQVLNSIKTKNSNKLMNEMTQQVNNKIHLEALPGMGLLSSIQADVQDFTSNVVPNLHIAEAQSMLVGAADNMINSGVNAVTNQFHSAHDQGQALSGQITGNVNNQYNNLNNSANQAMNGVGDQFQQASNMASTGLNNGSSSARNQANQAMGNLSNQFQQASNMASNNFNTANMNNQMQQATRSGVSNMSNQLKNGFASPMQGANTMMSALNGFATPAAGNNMASMMSTANGFAQGGGGGGAANMANSMMSAAANGFGANSPGGGPAGMANMANGMMAGLGNQGMNSMMAAAGMQSPSAQTMLGQYSPLASNGMAMLNNGFNTDNNRQQLSQHQMSTGTLNLNNNNSIGIAERGGGNFDSNNNNSQEQQQQSMSGNSSTPRDKASGGFSKGGSGKMNRGSAKMAGAKSGQIAPLDIEQGGGVDGSKGAFDANGMLIISDQTRQLFMKDYVISAYDHDLKDFIWQRRWCFRLSNMCETTSLLCMGASAVFAFLGANGNQTFALIAGVVSTVGIVLRGISHHASQESKESSVKLNALLKSLNMQGMNILSNGAEGAEEQS